MLDLMESGDNVVSESLSEVEVEGGEGGVVAVGWEGS